MRGLASLANERGYESAHCCKLLYLHKLQTFNFPLVYSRKKKTTERKMCAGNSDELLFIGTSRQQPSTGQPHRGVEGGDALRRSKATESADRNLARGNRATHSRIGPLVSLPLLFGKDVISPKKKGHKPGLTTTRCCDSSCSNLAERDMITLSSLRSLKTPSKQRGVAARDGWCV